MTVTDRLKSVSKESDADQRRIDDLQRHMPDSRAKRVIQGNVRRIHESLRSGLTRIVDGVLSGDVTRAGGLERAAPLMAPLFEASVRQGYIASGASEWDMTSAQTKSLREFTLAELEFFSGFLSELVTESLGRASRIGLYAGASEAAFWHGWLGMLPSSAQIEWRLAIAEHCPDCLRLAALGPYAKPGRGRNPLPTVPRNGNTQCVGNCRCHLVSTGRFESSLLNQIGIEVVAIGALAIDPTSEAAKASAQMYSGLAEQHAYRLRRGMLEPGTEWSGRAASTIREIEAVAVQFNHRVRLRADNAEILEPIRRATIVGLEYVEASTLSEEHLGLFAAILVADQVERGRITAISESPAGVILDDDPERAFLIEEKGGALLFVER